MSILKSIMHHWNSTSESYDTLHPETEYAQVTDFGQGTIAHLISSALASTVTACSTGSVFGKLVEKLLDASGMRYNFTNSNAWYICLGSLFGGLIIQGGDKTTTTGNSDIVSLPISFPNSAVGKLTTARGTMLSQVVRFSCETENNFSIKVWARNESNQYVANALYYLVVIGY